MNHITVFLTLQRNETDKLRQYIFAEFVCVYAACTICSLHFYFYTDVTLQIERVQNQKLYRQFMVQKKDLEEKSEDPGSVERRLWHGTSKEGVSGINNYGFNRSYCGANGWFFD